MNELKAIPKEISAEYGRDYAFLRAEGLKYIEQLSHKLWTDYNVHDPGITILELLCYAITDLGYRTSFPVKDLLASEKDNTANMHRQFLSALEILPSNPLSANDYRQLFVRIEGVRNAWILPSERWVVARFNDLKKEGVVESHYRQPGEITDPKKEHEFRLQGLNNILIDFDESLLISPEDRKKPQSVQETLIKEKKKEVLNRVMEVYQRYRNLCEDIDTIAEVPEQGVVICGEIEIEPKADPEQVWAEIVFNINQYLSPDVTFFSLQEMLEGGKQPDEIFNGPVFSFDDEYAWRTPGNPFAKKGFIRQEDLIRSELRKEVRLSDIIRVVMQTRGVKVVKEISFGLCDCDDQNKDNVRKALTGDKWNLCIAEGHKPVFCKGSSVLNLWKDVVPVMLKSEKALTKLDELSRARNTEMQTRNTEDLPIPEGRYRRIDNYQTIQNSFPQTYGIGEAGLPDSATTARKSQAKQLKAYLLFFEQVLANYFAQLANAKVLLSADNTIAKSYFANMVSGLKDVSEIFTAPDKWQQEVDDLLRTNGLDNYVPRRNRFLDHLLARFAEQFNEYVFLMHRMYAGDADKAVIRHKSDFLKDYQNLSTARGSGFDYYNPLPPESREVNVTGMEKRISRLLGFNNYRRQPLASLSYQIEKTGTITLPVNGEPKEVPVYGWKILMNGIIILESLNKGFLTRTDAYEEMGLASLIGCERENYKVLLKPNGKVSFNLVTNADKAGDTPVVIATHPHEYDALEGETGSGPYANAEQAINGIIHFLLNDFKTEGIYVVEHLLLRPNFNTPKAKHILFLPLCIESNGDYCRPLDPYSFRITVVLPGYSMRLRNRHFRRFAERLIRMETPAHVLPRICFVDEEHMGAFEEAWNTWLNERWNSKDPTKQAKDDTLTKLIDILEKMFTVYEQGQLTDCDDETPESNPVILGSSTLGSLEQGTKPEQPE